MTMQGLTVFIIGAFALLAVADGGGRNVQRDLLPGLATHQ